MCMRHFGCRRGFLRAEGGELQQRLAVGWNPSEDGNATPIKKTGGYSMPAADTGAYPDRFVEMAWCSTTINLNVS